MFIAQLARRATALTIAAATVASLVPPAAAEASSPARPVTNCVATGGSSGLSHLTGRRESGRALLAVKVNNMTRAAWPQAGLEHADQNFVQEVESGYTRHVALYSSTYPRRVGPVRSARETDIELLEGYGAPGLAFSGAATSVLGKLRTSPIVPLTESDPGRGFVRDPQRTRTHGPTHDLFVDATALESTARTRGAAPATKGLCFGALPAGGKAVTRADVHWPAQAMRATWNPTSKRFDLSYGAGTPTRTTWTDARTEAGARLGATNVVILMAPREIVRIAYRDLPNETPVPHTRTVGTGGAIVMRDGRAFTATWRRQSLDAPLELLTTAGQTMPLAQGSTWFMLTSQGRTVVVQPAGEPSRSAVIGTDVAVPPYISRHLATATTPPPPKPTVTRGVPVAGDWNGDGKVTAGYFKDGRWSLRNSHGSGPPDVVVQYGRAGDIPLVGDWNGDGRDTVGVVRGNRFLLRRTYQGGDDVDLTFGRVGDTPLAGDWNGDGRDTIGVRRGDTFILRPVYRSGSDIVLRYGRPTDRPVVGDFNGDGRDTVGVVRGSTFILRTRYRSGSDVVLDYGRATDRPVIGDWNGDGRDTVGVLRGSDQWLLRYTYRSGADYIYRY